MLRIIKPTLMALVILLAACAKEQNTAPVVIQTPDLGELAPFTNQVKVSFKFFDKSGAIEKSVCDFKWSQDNRMVGPCGNLAPGEYTYQLEYRNAISLELIVEASGTINIGRNNTVAILPELNIIAVPYAKLVSDLPIANAGDNQTAAIGTVVTLDGSTSLSTQENTELTYLWTAPIGISLSEDTVAQPTFTVAIDTEAATKLEFTLVVTDDIGLESEADRVEIVVTVPERTPPVSNTGINQVVEAGTVVTLDGSASITRSDSSGLTYLWTSPAGITLSANTVAQPTFTAPIGITADTKFEFSLVVTDRLGLESKVDTVEVLVTASIKTLPISNAGNNQVVEAGTLVTLDGSASLTTGDNTKLTYLWTSPTGITLSANTVAQPTFILPADTVAATQLVFSLVVIDGAGLESAVDVVEITVAELAEILTTANAGVDQVVEAGARVELDGSASVASSQLKYLWSKPAGINLSANDVVNPTFTLPISLGTVGTVFTFTLTVTDEKGNSASDIVDISILNFKPIANAGSDQNVEVGTEITLDASGSSDKNKDSLTYSWTAPVGVTLSDTSFVQPTFILSEGTKKGVMRFQVNVDDGNGGSSTDVVKITVLNTAPLANAGGNKVVVGANTVNFDGGASKDINGDTLSYAWTIIATPVGSTAILFNPTGVTSTFTTDVRGEYSVQLAVSDGTSSSIDTLQLISLAQPIPEMIVIPAGVFQMGDETAGAGDVNELPLRTVNINRFEMGKYEVTFDEYDAYLTSIGRAKGTINDEEAFDWGWGRGNRPVVEVSWNDIQAYIRWLNGELGLTGSINQYRLPTEAEWEYAARAGTTTTYSTGDCINTVQANYNGNAGYNYNKSNGTSINCPVTNLSRGQTVTVTDNTFSANPFGLFHMYGNVWEWVVDCWHDDYTGAPVDGTEWVNNCNDSSQRVLRGGSWSNEPRYLRSATRLKDTTVGRFGSNGFRLARTLF